MRWLSEGIKETLSEEAYVSNVGFFFEDFLFVHTITFPSLFVQRLRECDLPPHLRIVKEGRSSVTVEASLLELKELKASARNFIVENDGTKTWYLLMMSARRTLFICEQAIAATTRSTPLQLVDSVV